MDGEWSMGLAAAATYVSMLGYLLWQARYR